jgi:hypothetical protein
MSGIFQVNLIIPVLLVLEKKSLKTDDYLPFEEDFAFLFEQI